MCNSAPNGLKLNMLKLFKVSSFVLKMLLFEAKLSTLKPLIWNNKNFNVCDTFPAISKKKENLDKLFWGNINTLIMYYFDYTQYLENSYYGQVNKNMR